MIAHSKPFVSDLELNYVQSAIRTGHLVNGSFTKDFLSSLATFLQVEEVFYEETGTKALILALKALELREGAEIILPTYVCEDVFHGVQEAGFKPVLCDIGDRWVSTTEKVKEKINSKTGAIIVVYIFGITLEIQELTRLGIPVIEDVCQGLGLQIDNKMAGTFGDVAFSSFGAIKCITAGGVGGCVFSAKTDVANKLKDLKIKRSSILTEMQAAFGLAQIEGYDLMLTKRREIAMRYHDIFNKMQGVLCTSFAQGMNYRFVTKIMCKPEKLIKKFEEDNICLRRGVDQLLHIKFGIEGDFINSEQTFNTTVSWPIYPALTNDELDYILSVIPYKVKECLN